jgi:uncharacterized membrane protein
MESRLKVLGHPLHPVLVTLPIGLFALSVVFDLAYLVGGDRTFADVAFWDIAAGIVGGLLAAVFGLLDWLAVPRGTRAKRIGLWHGGGNVVIVGLFIVSWVLRLPDHAYLPSIVPFVLGLIGVLLALVTAWLGGELVYRLGVGVDPDAGLDAESSLERDGAVRARDLRRGGGTAA